jgi:hypothetical protein
VNKVIQVLRANPSQHAGTISIRQSGLFRVYTGVRKLDTAVTTRHSPESGISSHSVPSSQGLSGKHISGGGLPGLGKVSQ